MLVGFRQKADLLLFVLVNMVTFSTRMIQMTSDPARIFRLLINNAAARGRQSRWRSCRFINGLIMGLAWVLQLKGMKTLPSF